MVIAAAAENVIPILDMMMLAMYVPNSFDHNHNKHCVVAMTVVAVTMTISAVTKAVNPPLLITGVIATDIVGLFFFT